MLFETVVFWLIACLVFDYNSVALLCDLDIGCLFCLLDVLFDLMLVWYLLSVSCLAGCWCYCLVFEYVGWFWLLGFGYFILGGLCC